MPRKKTTNIPRVETLLLADRAEVLNGKLYIMGGGWDQVTISGPGQLIPVSIAISVALPRESFSRDHTLEVSFLGEAGNKIAAMGAHFAATSPPNKPGLSRRARFGFQMGLVIDRAGAYRVVAIVDGIEESKAEVDFFAVVPEEDDLSIVTN